ncbi:MAG: GNAT family N-acetyltransferase [Bacillaceae bacterium]
MIIRIAKQEDIDAITCIYNEAVKHTTATFDTVEKSKEEMIQWSKRYENPLYPLFVAEVGGEVVGYCCLNPFKEKDAYIHTVENSVYIHPLHSGKGIATKLLQVIIKEAITIGHKQMIAVITEGNESSIYLHQKFGFTHGGTLSEVGYKFNRWLSIHYYQLKLVK